MIILDILMPDKDGRQVVQELKLIPETKDIPVLITSIIDEQEMAFHVGVMDYFVKPIDKKRLLKRIIEMNMAKEAEVLVVDDNPADVHLVASMLEAEGIGVLRAYNGEEGVRIAQGRKPALIVLDLLMPDLSGFDVITKLRAEEATKYIPIVVLTVKDLSDKESKILSRQATAIMKKASFKREDFIREVKYAMDLSKKREITAHPAGK